MSEENTGNKKNWFHQIKEKYKPFIARFKALQGDPHYIAMGMGIGVFVAITPTIPFHTAIALALAFALKGSKPAAAIGVWLSNPATIPFFYWGSYKVGCFITGKSIDIDMSNRSIVTLMQMGGHFTTTAIIGGIILGIVPSVIAYFITLKVFKLFRSHKKDRCTL
jgi:uncharacterized protein (DUF2062 family)